MTPLTHTVRIDRLADRAAAYGMPGVQADGMAVESVATVVGEAVDRARTGGGPTLVEALTYRFCGHMPGDTEPYRTREEVAAWRQRDPITAERERLLRAGMQAADIEGCGASVAAALNEAESAAVAAPLPEVADLALGTADWMEWER
jgi:TPP-dependent pyruvate/acetoin dehydrogenase alpha subunit